MGLRAPFVAAVMTLAATVVLSAVTSAGARTSTPQITVASVRTTAFTATVTWEVDRAARVVVTFGAGTEPAIWSMPVSAPAAGRYSTTLTPLEPATDYRADVVALAGTARAAVPTTFRTGPMPVVVKSRATPTALKVNTRPFLPRMVFRQCPSAFPSSIAAGINVFMGTACGLPRVSSMALAGKALLIPDVQSRADGAGVIGWHQPDEADIQTDRPESLPLLPPSSRTGRTVFLTLSNHVWSGAAQLPGAATLYPKLVARAEMIGADIYPLQSFCNKAALSAVYAAQRELVELAPGKPTFQWIEADPMGVCAGLDPSPAIVRAETWMAFAGGARGIGYFPENWQPAVRQEITRLNVELRSLAPALLGRESAVSVAAPSPVVAGARTLNAARYVIAVNPRFGRTSARLTLPGLAGRSLRVWGEDRLVRSTGDVFTDRFRGLQARVYVVPPPGVS
jgi:hypothetical protein